MILKIVILFLATICTVLFLIGLKRGEKYNQYADAYLDADIYPLKEFYIVGWALNEICIFRLQGKLEQNLKKQAKLIWGNAYEMQVYITWGQFLTVALFSCCVGFILCGFVSGISMFLIFGIMILAVMAEWNLIISKMKEDIQKRKEACDMEFSNMISKLSLLINSGMILRDAWELVAYGKEGDLYDLMRTACECMKNGDSDAVAINKFGVLSASTEIMKFSSTIIQGMEKGNRELSDYLMDQASEQLKHKRQLALQQGEKAAGKLIIPLGITFAGIILIIVSASMQSLSF